MQPGFSDSEGARSFDEHAVWDDPASLRGEIFTEDQLAEHALALAHTHASSTTKGSARPLRRRFRETRKLIRQAYAVLVEGAEHDRDPSPAELWLLDNSHVVEGQLREIDEDLPWGYLVKLPRMDQGPMRGYPLVYLLCLEYLRHTDCHLDFRSLSRFVDAYQRQRILTIGELWAVPIMLRLGLVLSIGALASTEARADQRDLAREWAQKLLGPQPRNTETDSRESLRSEAREALQGLERLAPAIAHSDAFLVTLLKRLRERDDAPIEALDWIAAQTAELAITPDELARRYHLRQAADQVSVGNAITSMRSINSLDWSVFFAATSHVEAVLCRDPSRAYAEMDDLSRDRCRHALELLARRSSKSEIEIAERVLEMAEGSRHAAENYRAHVGYYLIDDGRPALERAIGYRPRLGARLRGWVQRSPAPFYLGSLGLLTLLLSVATWRPLSATLHASWLLVLLVPALLLASSEIAVAIVNALVVACVPPRILPKFNFERGIPEVHRTLIVVPTMLHDEAGLAQLLEELEVRSLANADDHLHFGLLTDFSDADRPEREGEQELLDHAVQAIERLNMGRDEPRFFLFHRRRTENLHEADPTRRYLGWERKRGKLDELNRLLRGAEDTSFQIVTAPRQLLARVRYVITLDTDTELPLGVARRLVATMAHPLNRPWVDPEKQRVVRGHAIIQPRVGTSPMSARRSLFARLAAGPPGIDPYTTAVSDVYQDLFGEGSFVGKGIYDVDAFVASVRGRVPENQVLSHDLLESIYARAALASDIEVLDEQPAVYSVAAGRQHRWTRGDWQLLPWLLPRVPGERGRRTFDFRAFDTWRVLDNLRRSLLAPALVFLGTCCWLAGPSAWIGSLLLAAVHAVPVFGRLVFAFARSASQLEWRGGLGGDLKSNSLQALLSLALLLDQAWLSTDAIVRALYRQFVSRQNLLEWTSMREAGRASGKGVLLEPRLLAEAILALVLGSAVAVRSTDTLAFAAPLLSLWVSSPWLVARISRIAPLVRGEPWGQTEALAFRRIARKTWRFFERFVGDQDHHLPPDNFQEDPRGVIAHRTSPTNIGLYLLSVAAARDLGFIGLGEARHRWNGTLDTIERLEKREGHVLNWYDTTTLAPLEPRYVSTVDSGNLAGYLWALSEACREAESTPYVGTNTLEAARDAGLLALELCSGQAGAKVATQTVQAILGSLLKAQAECERDPTRLFRCLRQLSSEVTRLLCAVQRDAWDRELNHWLDRLQRGLEESVNATDRYLRHERSLEALGTAVSDLLDERLAADWRSLVELARKALGPRGVLGNAQEMRERARALTERLGVGIDTQVEWSVGKFEADLERSEHEARAVIADLEHLSERADRLVEQMDFGFLYDDERSLFSIGYNVGGARLDNSHYDLLASEARLASLVAIAKGDIPEKHWFRLGRLRAEYASVPGLLSWSGSMFEYLMPLLVMRSYPDTLLDQTYHAAIERQIEHARGFDVPWGISEAAYNVMDLGMNYQYRAFGVPELGLKPGLGEDLVVAPYATALAALVRPRAAAQNFEALSRAGLEGSYGYYEAVDFTPSRLPPGRKQVVVKAFMAHHQGMTLVALGNLLGDFAMQRRFHADARIKACALLLEERIPVRAGVVQPETPRIAPSLSTALQNDASEHLDREQVWRGEVRGQLLGQGSVSTWFTSGGDGFTQWRGFDINRFREDSSLGCGGIYLYVRRLDENRLWSCGYLPTRAEPSHYDVVFSVDKIEVQRRDGDIETLMEIVLSPEQPAEVRRVTLSNHGSRAADLDLTSFTELSLSPRAADVAHPAFQKMFVETEWLEARGALIAHRRKRAEHEHDLWLAQLWVGGPEDATTAFCTSRSEFVGRGRSVEAPAALAAGSELSTAASGALDPALVLRRSIELAPGAQVRLSFVTLMAESRAALLELIELFAAPHSVPRAFELAWADARVELGHLGISSLKSHRYQRLLSAVLLPQPILRAEAKSVDTRGRDALWSQGISGDLPIVVVRLDDTSFSDLCRDLLLAHEYWRLNGFASDLVILNEEAPSYLQPVQEAVMSLIRSTPAEGHVDQRGGIFPRRAALIGEEDLQLLLCAARVVLSASQGSLAKQLRALSPKAPRSGAVRHESTTLVRPAIPPATPLPRVPVTPAGAERPELAFDNGLGGFDVARSEYVLVLGPGMRPPQPWSNVMAGPHFGALVTESGSSFSWAENSQKFRLTPWSNDPTLDPSGERFYVRDLGDDAVWSLTPGFATEDASYVVRHGQGYSSFEHERRGLAQRCTVAVSPDLPIKVWHVSLANRGTTSKRLCLYGYVEWVLGNHRETLRVSTLTSYRAAHRAILARNPFAPFPKARAFFATTEVVRSHTADREEFLGRWAKRGVPAALSRPALSGRSGSGFDPCAALEVEIEIPPGEERELCFVLGAGEDERRALELLEQFTRLEEAAAIPKRAAQAWRTTLGQLRVRTPDLAFDLLTNDWLLYQVLSCRLWGRSGFFQSGGAYGYRDQLQDCLALVHERPDLVRKHLLLCASRQFVEGDVQHWWHPDTGEGVRTHCSDDLLWLPWAALEYSSAVDDPGIWDEPISFLQERLLEPGEDDLYSVPPISAEAADLYEHCVRALEAANTRGARGLPLMRAGDWNDGMNRVGWQGQGESVWLAWFLADVLGRFAELAECRGDSVRAAWCRSEARRIAECIDGEAWDGEWYRRAFFDDGRAVGSRDSAECQVDAIAQSWAVIAGCGRPERAERALNASLRWLWNREEKMLLLLTPPFTGKGPDPGYIAAYPPGIRENGGQYTHGILWSALALLKQGRGDEGQELLAMLNPIRHASRPEEVAKYQVEPYVLAADVYSQPPHVGRGGWTWYTGSASWMYRIGVEWLLGIRRRGPELEIAPTVPGSWSHFEVDYRTPGGGQLRIVFENPRGVSRGVERLVLDGVAVPGQRITLPTDQGDHVLLVTLGQAGAASAALTPERQQRRR